MPWIKKLYLYVVSLVALIMLIIAAVTLLNMGLKFALNAEEYPYYPSCTSMAPVDANAKAPVCNEESQRKEEEFQKKNQTQQRKRDVAQSLAMILVGTPVFWYHWKLARKEV